MTAGFIAEHDGRRLGWDELTEVWNAITTLDFAQQKMDISKILFNIILSKTIVETNIVHIEKKNSIFN